ncbi:MAG TPA: ABC transporter [Gammaproteobacteria bacterium]|nr:ABC transporter [Gammaproteobacteria bacterium]
MAQVTCELLTKTVDTPEGPLTILDHLTLEVAAGDSLAIVGASGSGKSTLLGLLAGLDLPSSGEVFINNVCLTQLSEDERASIRAKHIGFIFQSFQLLPQLTALENVMLPLELADIPDAKQRAVSIMEQVGLSHRQQQYPKVLSGGEQQRVAIARAYATHPDILFADEPTGNLDTKTGAAIIDLLFQLNDQERATLILVTHDPKLAARCARQITLSEGRIVNAS